MIKKENNCITDPKKIKLIGKRISMERCNAHLSQRELGELIHVKKDVIQRLESGDRRIINEKTKHLIRLIALKLTINADYLLADSDNPLTLKESVIPATQLPEYNNLPERFIYQNGISMDFEYVAEYMHPKFQTDLANLIHIFVDMHRCAVHFPNITKEEARKLDHIQLMYQREHNFFINQYKKENERKSRETI